MLSLSLSPSFSHVQAGSWFRPWPCFRKMKLSIYLSVPVQASAVFKINELSTSLSLYIYIYIYFQFFYCFWCQNSLFSLTQCFLCLSVLSLYFFCLSVFSVSLFSLSLFTLSLCFLFLSFCQFFSIPRIK